MSVDTQLASPHAGVLYLVELHFASGTARLTNWSHMLPWAGYDWLALNAVTSVSAVRVSERTEFPAMDLGLNIANSALLATACGNAAEYRGRDIVLYQAFLDDELKPLEDPELAWAGVMDQVRVSTGNGEDDGGSITLRCENPQKDKRGVRSLRLNNAQHQKRWPGDTFLSRVEGLSGKPAPWLSRRFQEV